MKSAKSWSWAPTDSLSMTWPARMSFKIRAIAGRKAFSVSENFVLLLRVEEAFVNSVILKLNAADLVGPSVEKRETMN